MINKVCGIENNLKSLDLRVEMLEISDRDDVVIIDGIEPEPNKSLAYSVCNQLNKHIDLKLDPKEIIQCSYIGKADDDGNNVEMTDTYFNSKARRQSRRAMEDLA